MTQVDYDKAMTEDTGSISQVFNDNRFEKDYIGRKRQPGTPFFSSETKKKLQQEVPLSEEFKQKIEQLQNDLTSSFKVIDLDQSQVLWLYSNLGQDKNKLYTQWLDISTSGQEKNGQTRYVGQRVIQLDPKLYLVLEYGEASKQIPAPGHWFKHFFDPDASNQRRVPTLEPTKGQLVRERPHIRVQPVEDIIMKPLKNIISPPNHHPLHPFEKYNNDQNEAAEETTQKKPEPIAQ